MPVLTGFQTTVILGSMAEGGSQYTVDGQTHYQRNKENYISRTSIRRRELAQWLRDLKVASGCVDCGNNDFRVLDFDHVGPKTITPSQMIVKGWGKERMLKELEQCEVRCANCHRIVTYERTQALLV